MPEPILRLVGVKKRFGSFEAVRDIDLGIFEGEFLTIVGPSGSGKTTLIRMLAGLEAPSAGDILLRGARINELSGQPAADLHGLPVPGPVPAPARSARTSSFP